MDSLRTLSCPLEFTSTQVDEALAKQAEATEGSVLRALSLFPRGRAFINPVRDDNMIRKESTIRVTRWSKMLQDASNLVDGLDTSAETTADVARAVQSAVQGLEAFLGDSSESMLGNALPWTCLVRPVGHVRFVNKLERI